MLLVNTDTGKLSGFPFFHNICHLETGFMNECVAVRSPLCPKHRLIKIKVPRRESKIASHFLFFVEPHCVSLGLKGLLSPGFKLQQEAFFFFSNPSVSVGSDHLLAKGICNKRNRFSSSNSSANKVILLSFSDSLPTRLRHWLMVENRLFSTLECRNLERTKKKIIASS